MLTIVRRTDGEADPGFTLIELLVVIVIIGVLAAIAIPIFLNQRKNAYEASVKSDLKNAVTAMEGYYAAVETYPGAGGPWTEGAHSIGPEQLVVSPGNTVTYVDPVAYGVPGAYCLSVANPQSARTWVFKSDVGAIQPSSSGACP